MTDSHLASEVQALFDDYIAAWGSERLASIYYTPCIAVRADGSIHCFQTPEEINQFFGTVAKSTWNNGARQWKVHNVDVIPIGTRSAHVTLEWEMLRADGSSIRRWPQSYNLVRIDGRLRVLTSTLHAV